MTNQIIQQVKMEKKETATQLQQLCEMHTCQSAIYFETRKKQDLYLWIGRFPDGPSVKFFVENIHTSKELKMTGNCLKGSRPVLSFDSNFEDQPHLKLTKEVIVSAFNVPQFHPKSQPFIDHVFSFTVDEENKIWFRNYQIFRSPENKNTDKFELYEIGPRFILNPMCILDNLLTGQVLYQNPQYQSPNQKKILAKRKIAKEHYEKKLMKKKKIVLKEVYEENIKYKDIDNKEIFE